MRASVKALAYPAKRAKEKTRYALPFVPGFFKMVADG